MDKRKIFEAIRQGQVSSRREIANLFALRSTSVSDMVGQLTESGLVVEVAGRAAGRGRPASVLVANTRALAVLVFQVVSQSLRATIVDIAGSVLRSESLQVPADCDNSGMQEAFTQLFERSIQSMPQGTCLTAINFSLSGLLDVTAQRWLFSSRWPGLSEFELGLQVVGHGLTIAVTRNLDAELQARLGRGAVSDATLILHWGYGIGTAYAIDGRVVNAASGRFGEIGHWRLASSHGETCRCGRHGCLETVAALWALHPALAAHWPEVAIDESEFADQARGYDLLSVPVLQKALEAMVVGLANLCRILFPRHVVVSGPFTANAAVWARFNERFQTEAGLAGSDPPKLISGQRNEELELEGAARPLLNQALESRLQEASEC